MLEVCERPEHKLLKGNSAVRSGMGRFKPDTKETGKDPWKYWTHQNEDTVVIASISNEKKYQPELELTRGMLFDNYSIEMGLESFIICIDNPASAIILGTQQASFAEEIWTNMRVLLSENREEEALVYLYENLVDELENIEKCNSFLSYSIGMEMSSNIIVHIFNALSPIRSSLTKWDEFKNYAVDLLTKKVGEKNSKILLKAII